MVVILSIEDDLSTNGVMDWLDYYKVPVLRINSSDKITNIRITSDMNVDFDINGRHVDLSKVKAFWYRRGKLALECHQVNEDQLPIANRLNEHLKAEHESISDLIMKTLRQKSGLSDYFTAGTNKFEILGRALKCGLQIPETLVTNQKAELLAFMAQHQSIITKPNQDVFFTFYNNQSVMSYTSRLKPEDVAALGDTFSPSTFQQEVKKRYELRIFYLRGRFYSMAIFSQLDSQTAVDFRVYNHQHPNRNVPYKLPVLVEQKLDRLMTLCGYDTGSIDMIYSDNHEYIFLEINPVGQFDMVSVPCNYYLTREIAHQLK